MKLKDIKGLLPEKWDLLGKGIDSEAMIARANFNEAVDIIGEKEIEVDEIKVRKIIQDTAKVIGEHDHLHIAQAIAKADIWKIGG